MKELFVSYNVAKQLKDKGFNETCIGYFNEAHEFSLINRNSNVPHDNKHYENLIACPTHQQIISWLLIKRDVIVHIYSKGNDGEEWYFIIKKGTITDNDVPYYDYMEAVNKAIEKALTRI